ncbi:MAG TPA: zinc ribbon domain-containing protein [Clostridia bacterium]
MFCSNCGNSLTDGEAFCTSCGKNTSTTHSISMSNNTGHREVFQNTYLKNTTQLKYIIMGACCVIILTFFLSWISIPTITGLTGLNSSANLLNISNVLNEFFGRNSKSSSLVEFIKFFIYICYIIPIICGWFLYKLYSDYEESTNTGKTAMNISAFLAAAFIVIAFFTNSELSNESKGLFNNALKVEIAPYAILAIALFTRLFLISKLENAIWYAKREEKNSSEKI